MKTISEDKFLKISNLLFKEFVDVLATVTINALRKKEPWNADYIRRNQSRLHHAARNQAMEVFLKDNGKGYLAFLSSLEPLFDLVKMLPPKIQKKEKIKAKASPEWVSLLGALNSLDLIERIDIFQKGTKPLKFSNPIIIQSIIRGIKDQLAEGHNRGFLSEKNDAQVLEIVERATQTMTTDLIRDIRQFLVELFPTYTVDRVNGIAHRILEIQGMRSSKYSEKAKRQFIAKRCR